MPGGGSRTPASMIMAGILQVRQAAIEAFQRGNYYQSAWLYAQMASLLPVEAYKDGKFKLEKPPTAGKQEKITPDIEKGCREYIERNMLLFNEQIPRYVYQYFERGRKMMRGY